MKAGSSESQAEAEELNQSQTVETGIVIGLSFRFCFQLRQSGIHYIDHKRNGVSDGVVRGVVRKWECSDSSDSNSVALMTPLSTAIFDFH